MELKFVYLIVTSTIHRKGKKKFMIIKCVMVIDPIMWYFEITQYDDKRAMTIENLVETVWLTIHS